MGFRPNYRQQRSERTRSKQQKKQEKIQKREEDAAKRRSERDGEPVDGNPAEGGAVGGMPATDAADPSAEPGDGTPPRAD
jgi:hypothetical protein